MPEVDADEPAVNPNAKPVQQIDGKVPYKVSYEMVTPEQANDWIRHADSDPDFKQRPCTVRDVQRWKIMIETDRFVHYLPNGVVCFDDKGMLLNGKHRLTGLAGQSKPAGFVVFRNVPRWMFAYFDTGRSRSLNDVFKIAGRMSKSQTGSTARCALRYEEMLNGVRGPLGWQDWGSVRDEHADVNTFLDDRGQLQDLYLAADKTYRSTRLVISALMVFRYYQFLAWPEGEPKLLEFWDGLQTGAMLATGSPALELREWSKDQFESRERVRAKREQHLLLLYRFFAHHVNSSRLERVTWAYGMPMPAPYHPEGAEVAIKNIRAAIESGNC